MAYGFVSVRGLSRSSYRAGFAWLCLSIPRVWDFSVIAVDRVVEPVHEGILDVIGLGDLAAGGFYIVMQFEHGVETRHFKQECHVRAAVG